MPESLPPPHDDGLLRSEDVGSWAEDKHSLVGLYSTLFSSGMKNKWDCRVYIELHAGAGLAKVRGASKFLWGSPLLALSVKDPFDRYVFCESDTQKLQALRSRVQRYFPNSDVRFVSGECDANVSEILSHIPGGSQEKVLSFCFADPYDLSLRFSTIRKLAQRRVDFLILLALHMDANRNLSNYLSLASGKVEEFLGLSDWRQRWAELPDPKDFSRFLAEMYASQMETLHYLAVPLHKMKQVRSDGNAPLYRLALFSRHHLAYTFWEEVLRYSTAQQQLFRE